MDADQRDEIDEWIAEPICVASVSKTVAGQVAPRFRWEPEWCAAPRCVTYHSPFPGLALEVASRRCDGPLSKQVLGGRLVLDPIRLSLLVEPPPAKPVGPRRALHRARYHWRGTGAASGVSNVGLYRSRPDLVPLVEEKCEERWVWYGHLEGVVEGRSGEEYELRCQYRLLFTPQGKLGPYRVTGTVEGALLSHCADVGGPLD